MVQSHYPDSVIIALPDFEDNTRWARELDKRIREVYQHGDVLLYGSRDSFIPYYHQGGGKFQTKELEPLGTFAGTDVRRLISEEVKNSIDFRSGVIYQSYNIYPKVIPTVDIAPLSSDGTKVLLGRKYDENSFRFIGGFLIPSDDSSESAVERVFHSEAGLSVKISDINYIGNTKIDDWRFRGEEDKIITTFFTCKYIWGEIQPNGEIGELKWFDIKSIKLDEIINEHQVLLKMLRNEK
jgi:bifunctional NMN adenylyltransferase/nudix hydrolase